MAKKVHLISLASGVHAQLKPLFDYYHKQMKRYACAVSVLEIEEKKWSEQHLILEKKIQQLAQGQAKQVFLLSERGKIYDSPRFAQWIETMIMRSQMVFLVIGTHQGFSNETQKLFPESLSLSPLTFPHQLVPLLILEQLYRAESLIENRPYHY